MHKICFCDLKYITGSTVRLLLCVTHIVGVEKLETIVIDMVFHLFFVALLYFFLPY